tara:strand:+ start:354 stop:533 length:180 start_codon:yes stop_codon:yes gene_type:complete
MIIFIIFLLLVLAIVIWGYWLYEIELSPMPETEQEKHVRQMKLRITDAKWKFKREIGEL